MWRPCWIIAIALVSAAAPRAREIIVSPSGSDADPGTVGKPLRTWKAAQQLARKLKATEPVTILFRAGTYYLPQTVVFGPEDSGTSASPVVYAAYPGEDAVISGGERLKLAWRPFRDGIFVAGVPAGFETDQLFVDGRRQPMARYPNFDPSVAHFNGWSPDAFSKERAARWSNPAGGFMHVMHKHLWGDFHYRITGKDASGNLTYEGGWQNNRQLGMHDRYRFVENIFEELDSPGEWFLDRKAARLYFYPPSGLNLQNATVEAVHLRHLIEFRGTEYRPVHDIQLRGLTFRHAARTFMETREPLLRSDWTIYRGGAILLTGAEDCALEELVLDQVGGNAIFLSDYNRRVGIRRVHISGAGANGVTFAGSPAAVRNPLFDVSKRLTLAELDRTPGPKSNNYPAACVLEDSLIHETGRFEKQTAPVQISMSQGIIVRHCSIYDVPRAGINISEGTWGAHLIDGCDVFDTVKETGDHGSFNSWGRDRYWNLNGVDNAALGTGDLADLPTLDAVQPTIIRNSRWRCDHGWDIDLDDGSSNYRIYNNLTLSGGIKLREGFFRVVENNIIANNSLHPHVWYPNSRDIVRRNILFTEYKPVRVPTPWGAECDRNLVHRSGSRSVQPARGLQKQSGRDEESIECDAMIDSAYRVAPDSPAIKLGFQLFPLDQFGVQWPKLKAIARTPDLSPPGGSGAATLSSERSAATATWLGATVRNLVGLGEVSATGMAGETGVLVLQVPPQSRAAAAGIQTGDVIVGFEGKPVPSLPDLVRLTSSAPAFGIVEIRVWRGQRTVQLSAQAPI